MRFAYLRVHGCDEDTWLGPEGASRTACRRLRPRRAQHGLQTSAWATYAIKNPQLLNQFEVLGQASVSGRWNHRGLGRPQDCRVKGIHDALRSIWGGA